MSHADERGSAWRQPVVWAAAAAILFVYVAVVAWLPRDTFWSPDEGGKFIQMRATRWDGGVQRALLYRGQDLDRRFKLHPSLCRFGDFYPTPLADGGVRFHWPIWFPLASRGFYALFGMAGLYVIPVLSGWSMCLLAGALAGLFARRLVAPAIALTGVATPVAFYSVTFWEHTLASAFGVAAVVLAAGAMTRRSSARVVLAVVCLCAATLLRLEMLAFALALAAAAALAARPSARALRDWLSRPGRRIQLGVAIVVILATAALVASNLPPRHIWNFKQLANRLLELFYKLPRLPSMLVEILVNATGQQGPVLPAVASWGGLAALLVGAVAPWTRGAKSILTLVSLAALAQFGLLLWFWPQPYVSLHGVFAVAPYLVLAGHAVAAARGETQPRRLVIFAAACYALFGIGLIVLLLTPAGNYQTGLEWGTRNVLTLYPLGVVASLVALDGYARSGRTTLAKNIAVLLFAVLVLESALLEVRGVRMLRRSRQQVAAWQAMLPTDQPIITDTWWLPLQMAPFYTEHIVHCMLEKRPMRPWAERVGRRKFKSFTFASLSPFDPRVFIDDDVPYELESVQNREGLHVATFRLLDKKKR